MFPKIEGSIIGEMILAIGTLYMNNFKYFSYSVTVDQEAAVATHL